MVNKCNHLLSDILLIGLFSYLSGGEDYEEMVLFAENHYDFVKEYCQLPNGIPSQDTFNQAFRSLEPSILNRILTDQGGKIIETLSGKQICFDGKAIKGVSPRGRGKSYYVVSAWVGENEICMGQKKIDDKSNEITAIPELIGSIDVENAIVSIDAMDCQKEITDLIISKKGHYLLSLKGNQGELYEDVISAKDFLLEENLSN